MTNRERLNALPDGELMKEMHRLCQSPAFNYVNWEEWLNSEETALPYIGKHGIFKAYDVERAPWNECIILDEYMAFNTPYAVLLAGNVVVECPKSRVKEISIGEFQE